MNNNDLAALAALGAMGYMYKNHLDKQGEGSTSAAGPAGYEGVVPGSELGSQGNFRFGDAARDAGAAIQESNRGLAGAQRSGSSPYPYVDQPRSNRPGIGGGGAAAEDALLGTGRYEGQRFPSNLPASTSVVPDAAPEDSGMGGAGLAGAGAAGAGAAAYYAKVRRQARLADEARAKMKAEAQRGILKDRAQAGVDEDRDARARAQNEADRVAKAQAQADADAKNRAIQAEIDDELKRYKNKTKGANDRAGVNKSAAAAGPTVTRETSTSKRAPAKAEVPTDMDDFNRMLRESKVGRTGTAAPVSRTSANTQTREDAKADEARQRLSSLGTTEESKRVKARGMAGKVGLAATALGLGTAANAATDMTAGEREKLIADVVEGLITPIGLTSGLAGEGSDLYPSKPLTRAERNKNIEAFLANMSPADKKKYDEAVARQNPKLLDAIKRPSAANKRAAGGQIKTKRMASGGMTSTMSSASKRGDGIASKGKTRCKMY